ncbi:MAG: sporulation transcriptional regulator SpoIIID [Agathobacter sp.]|nr:sporulation transcriptional regulator SpoIIID [Agathobacter sp.]
MKLCLSKEQRVQREQKKSLKAQWKHPQPKPFRIVPTIHKDCSDRLLLINPTLATEVRKVLDVNKAERHIRGGLATKEKYLKG